MLKKYTFLVNADEEYKKDCRLKREDVQALQDWASKESHLPKISELKMAYFLHSNYYKIEATKQCIEHYYTIRANCPDIFGYHNVSAKVMKDTTQFLLNNVVVSKPEYKVAIVHVYNPNADLMHLGPIYCFLDIMTHIMYAQHGTSDGHIVIVDGSGIRLSHVFKMQLLVTKIIMFYVQVAMPIRLKAIHIVNVSQSVEKMYTFFKPFIKGELLNMFHMHSSIDEFHKCLPMDSIPKDLGGDGPSYDELHADQVELIEANAEWILELGEQKADESTRQHKIDFGDMFGYEGTFKKLQID